MISLSRYGLHNDRRSLWFFDPRVRFIWIWEKAERERKRFRRGRVEWNETTFLQPFMYPIPPAGFFYCPRFLLPPSLFGLRSVRKRRVENRNFPSTTRGAGMYMRVVRYPVGSPVFTVLISLALCANKFRGSKKSANGFLGIVGIRLVCVCCAVVIVEFSSPVKIDIQSIVCICLPA